MANAADWKDKDWTWPLDLTRGDDFVKSGFGGLVGGSRMEVD